MVTLLTCGSREKVFESAERHVVAVVVGSDGSVDVVGVQLHVDLGVEGCLALWRPVLTASMSIHRGLEDCWLVCLLMGEASRVMEEAGKKGAIYIALIHHNARNDGEWVPVS